MTRNGHKNPKAQPWDQQPEESNPAFAAYRCYYEMGEKRSIRAVAQKLSKSSTIMRRWSKRWNWPARIRKQTKSLVDTVDTQAKEELARRSLPDIMGANETLARASMLARADIGLLLDSNGKFDVKNIRKRGLSYMLSSVKTTTRRYRSGLTVVTQEFKIEQRLKFLELLGKHHGLWDDEYEDPLDRLAALLKIPRALLPAKFDPEALDVEPTEL